VIESRDAIFDEERFSSIPRPKANTSGTKDRDSSVVPHNEAPITVGAREEGLKNLSDQTFNFIWLKDLGMKLGSNIHIVIMLMRTQGLLMRL